MASRDAARPNIVFILSDDQGPWALGAAGNDEVITPTLDDLAAGGARFSSFFCTSPVCSPARASLFTGQIPSQHGVHDWLAGRHVGPTAADFLADRRLITNVLSESGYRCGLSGKWHLGANDHPRPGFVHWLAHQRGGGTYYNAPVVRDGRLQTQPGYLTDALTADAVDFIGAEADRAEPFWLSLHYTAPHSPWKDNHPPEIVACYDDCAFATCPQEPAHPWLRRRADGSPAAREDDLRAALQGYYAAITAMDAGISRVLDALHQNQLTESTLVVFSSDNGFNCGHHGVWGKGNGTYPQNMYDSSVKVPAIFSQPGRIPAGTVIDELVSGYDMSPTLLDWVGLPGDGLGRSPGRSFTDLLDGGDAKPRERIVVFDEYGPVRMIRTRDWKYVHRYIHGGHELYHLSDDPNERRNLIGDPEHQRTVAELRAELDAWFDTYAEPDHDGAHLDVTGYGQLAPLGERTRPFAPLPESRAADPDGERSSTLSSEPPRRPFTPRS